LLVLRRNSGKFEPYSPKCFSEIPANEKICKIGFPELDWRRLLTPDRADTIGGFTELLEAIEAKAFLYRRGGRLFRVRHFTAEATRVFKLIPVGPIPISLPN
jgi:hypothetical protein